MLRLTWALTFMLAPALIASAQIARVWLLDEGARDVAGDSTRNGNDGVIEAAT